MWIECQIWVITEDTRKTTSPSSLLIDAWRAAKHDRFVPFFVSTATNTCVLARLHRSLLLGLHSEISLRLPQLRHYVLILAFTQSCLLRDDTFCWVCGAFKFWHGRGRGSLTNEFDSRVIMAHRLIWLLQCWFVIVHKRSCQVELMNLTIIDDATQCWSRLDYIVLRRDVHRLCHQTICKLKSAWARITFVSTLHVPIELRPRCLFEFRMLLLERGLG